ncbi:MAG: leucine-rich repeat domain-containing protein [Treponema sp.]|nr:leucine-rich repeat domain-containing protein [Treponema sp.]
MQQQIPIKKHRQENISCGLRGALTALAVALALLYAGMFTACSDNDHQDREDAAGRALIRIAGSNQRTVYPDTGDFVKYTLIFTGENGKSAPDVVLEHKTSVEIALEPGTWIITATGWTNSAGSVPVPAVCGSVEVTVVAGRTTQAEIVMNKPVTESGIHGTFTWRVRFPADAVESGSMLLSVLKDGAFSPYSEVDMLEQSEGSVSLPPGYYLVEITLSSGGAETGRSEVVYIYSGTTTALPDMEFTMGDFPPHDAEPESSALEISIGAGEVIDIRGLPPGPVILTGTGAEGVPSSLSLTVTGFTRIECWLDGQPVAPASSGNNTEAAFFINAYGLHSGRHFLSFAGVKNGVPHGREILLSVDPPASIEADSVESLAKALAALPPNTQEYPYHVTMNGVNISGSGTTGNTLRTLYNALNRYVALDLSGSSGNTFVSITPTTAPGKQYVVSVVLPASITKLDSNALLGCTALVFADMPGVLTVERGAFDGCVNLSSVSLPEATNIANTTKDNVHGAFYNCVALTSVYVPKVATIGHHSFSGCTALATISLPSVMQIDDAAFKNCNNLVSVYMPESATVAGTAFAGCTALVAE